MVVILLGVLYLTIEFLLIETREAKEMTRTISIKREDQNIILLGWERLTIISFHLS